MGACNVIYDCQRRHSQPAGVMLAMISLLPVPQHSVFCCSPSLQSKREIYTTFLSVTPVGWKSEVIDKADFRHCFMVFRRCWVWQWHERYEGVRRWLSCSSFGNSMIRTWRERCCDVQLWWVVDWEVIEKCAKHNCNQIVFAADYMSMSNPEANLSLSPSLSLPSIPPVSDKTWHW